MKFKAAILTEINKPLSIDYIDTTELQIGQVLVKILVSGLCGAQLQEIAGHKGNSNFLPHLMGHEGCGIVEEIGPGVTKVKVGDKVVMHWRKADGIESNFPSYIYNGSKMSSGKVTTLSEFSIVSENRLTSVPQDTPNELCALLGCAMTTALGTITNEAQLKFGESVLIVGCGGLGLHLIEASKLSNASPIIAIDISDEKEQLSKEIGANSYINVKKININDVIKDGSMDVIIETTGDASALESVIPKLSGNGRLILVGQAKPGIGVTIPNANKLFSGNGQSIKATQGGKTNPSEDIPRYIKLNKMGLLSFNKLITNRFDLDNINDAIELLRSGKAGRIMIDINKK